ncbi:Pimeloyl-ACP methyl ester carboxylesterase [Amphibacillus marinus]|uniref:Pimeloyl-ACP methyl ester carboxylesterase n=1 Tax=Amphibacillus marinus TaxID=872970 RepID=A0A1H8GNS9_9BACI|nr:alpha/beta hydrolase [Amphibacillus marinus]SEN45672.1 Pimeloyl-ACP methyl ester carboxylesterase [Amphibacillus marinus]
MKCVAFNQSKIYYEVVGAGQPILFIHPPGLGRLVFHYQSPLCQQFKLIMPDLSGHGASTAPYQRNIIKQYCQEIEAILDQENINSVIICAYSAGGIVAQIFASQYANRVNALIVSGGFPKVSTQLLRSIYIAGMLIIDHSSHFLANRLAASNAQDEEQKQRLKQHINKSDVLKWAQFYHNTYQVDIRHYVKQIACPSLFIYGDTRDFTHYYAKLYRSQPHIQLAYVDDGSHQIPAKKPDVFNQLIINFVKHV